MRNLEGRNSWNQVLVGFAIDVSGSMEQSIRNKSRTDESRFESFKDSLRRLSKETKREIENCRQEGFDASITVFAYAFGLKESDHCDLLSLLELDQQMMPNSKGKVQRNYNDPYQEIAEISKRYGVKDMDKYTKWGQEILSPKEARQLANRMYEYPKMAERLTSLLPESFSQVEERVVKETAKGAAGGGAGGAGIGTAIGFLLGGPLGAVVGGTFGGGGGGRIFGQLAKDNSIKEERQKLEKPEKLAQELANASDEEIRKIIIREIGGGLQRELRKHGDTRMPLEQVANGGALIECGTDRLSLL